MIDVEALMEQSGLIECLDDCYVARGDWRPEAQRFAPSSLLSRYTTKAVLYDNRRSSCAFQAERTD
jgi:hypothetical protein